MPRAVGVYKRLRDRHAQIGLADAEDYVFMPTFKDINPKKNEKARDDALIQIQRQFAVILEMAGLGDGPNDERRTLYSLRHSCCPRRMNIDPPCRSNIDPGRVAAF